MTRRVAEEEFAAGAGDLLDAASAGETVIVTRDGRPLALLSPPGGPSLEDLPRWERWLDEMRAGFPARPGRVQPAGGSGEPEPVDKGALGFDPSSGRVGSTAGREHLAAELARLGSPVSDGDRLGEIYAAVLELCDGKESVYAEDLRLVAQEKLAEAPGRLRLLSVTVSSATGMPATAEVTMQIAGTPAMRREQGDGPLDAAINAIERLTGLTPAVENFSVVAATRGHDAVAEAVIELALDGSVVVGAGASTNAIEAGVHAYVNALNFLLEAGDGGA